MNYSSLRTNIVPLDSKDGDRVKLRCAEPEKTA